MLQVLATPPGLLFGSFLYRHDLFTEQMLLETWQEKFGESFIFYPSHNPLMNYYSQEMGEPTQLRRFFVVTTSLKDRGILVPAKLEAMKWEKIWSQDSKRHVNLDIGVLAAENFVLATTKNYSHRTYLDQNIFADLSYYFHQGTLQTLPWTYPDYLDAEKIEFFGWCRSYLLEQLLASG